MKRIFTAALVLVLTAAFVSVPICAADGSAEGSSAGLSVNDLSAHAAVLIEADSGEVIFEKNADKRLPMASTTKIMTAVTVLENASPDDLVVVAEKACGIEGSSIYLVPGEELTIGDLLYALMLESANDAATALACAVSGSIEDFAALMNETADKIGLADSHFTNPHGLDDEAHYTTAADLARLASYAMKNPEFAKIVSTEKNTIPSSDGEGLRYLSNHNRLLGMSEDVNGVKTGFTKRSGRCLVSSAQRGGVSVIAVTLNAPDDWNDHLALHELGFSSYESVSLAEAGKLKIDIPCPGADDGKITLSNRDSVTKTVKNGSEIKSRIESGPLRFPPVNESDICAYAYFFADGQEIAKIPLYSEETVLPSEDKPSLGERILGLLN